MIGVWPGDLVSMLVAQLSVASRRPCRFRRAQNVEGVYYRDLQLIFQKTPTL